MKQLSPKSTAAIRLLVITIAILTGLGAATAHAATFLVTTNPDSGPGSLRQAIADANLTPGSDTINFDAGVFAGPQTITLTTGQLVVSDDLTINGPGAANLTISGNNASRVFYIAPGNTVTLDAMTIANGLASGDVGGGIYNDRATLTVSYSTVRNNLGSGFGGGIFNSGTLTVSHSTVRNNSSSTGGGIASRDSAGAAALNINNSTVSGNSAGSGGGIYSQASVGAATLNVSNSTVSSNSASTGGGIRNIANPDHTATATLSSTVVSDNSAPTGPDITNNATLTGSYNLVETTTGYTFSSGMNNIFGVDPLLRPLADNGGPTQTHAFLSVASPALDQGNSFGSTTDQRGETRPVDIFGFPNAADGADIGAYELQSPLVVDNTTDNGALSACTAAANDCSLRGANSIANDGDTIVFDPGVFGNLVSPEGVFATITLGSEIAITDDLVINGPGSNQLVISGNNASRVFYIAPGNTVTLDGLTIANGAVSGGFPTGFGGGIYNDEATLTVSNSIVRDNDASGFGGGIYNDSGTLTVNFSTVNNNTSSTEAGGGIANRNTSGGAATLNVNNSTVSGNSAATGGGINNQSGSASGATVNITNSTVSGNSTAASGGGIYNFCSSGAAMVVVSNSTISSNSAASNGGGIQSFEFLGATATVTLSSTLVSDNSAPSEPDISSLSGTTVSGSYNLVETIVGYTFSSGTNNIFSVDPLLQPLADNGGPTFTHRLSPFSPAIDKGNSFGQLTDQRGFARIFNFPVPNAGDGADIGAFEHLGPTTAAVSISGNVRTPKGMPIRNALVTIFGGDLNEPVTVATGTFGTFSLTGLRAGQTYVVMVSAGRYTFAESVRTVVPADNVDDLDFVAN